MEDSYANHSHYNHFYSSFYLLVFDQQSKSTRRRVLQPRCLGYFGLHSSIKFLSPPFSHFRNQDHQEVS